jgi:RsiW-degrading membrane proteinase PrsW (M82 family)
MTATRSSASGIALATEQAQPQPRDENAVERTLLLRAIGRWIRVFWPLAATILVGFVSFGDAIGDSIASTPHPQLVYAIFLVVAVAAGLLGILLNTIVNEHRWLELLEEVAPTARHAALLARGGEDNISVYYRMLAKTRGEPLLERQRLLEHELENAEVEIYGRLALPNLLSGSLVGLGLVGTFIGLLGTLQELSGVFAALGRGQGGGDTATMFATMIDRLKGPMQGMGTAFVASLYGLLGSLVVGLTATSVRRAGERLFNEIRAYATEQLHSESGVLAEQATGARPARSIAVEEVSLLPLSLLAENERLRQTFDRWRQDFGKQIVSFEDVASRLGTQIQDAVKGIADETKRGIDRLDQQRQVDELIVHRLTAATSQLDERIEALRAELQEARQPRERGPRQIFLHLGAAAGLLAALGVAFLSGRVSAPRPADLVRVETRRVPIAEVAPKATPAAAQPATPTGPQSIEITALQGDSLSRIASRYDLPLDAVVAANPDITQPDIIAEGQKIRLPGRPAAK